jgi:hypothetical protein
MKYLVLKVTLAGLISACNSEIGSEAWCQSLKQKDKGDWTGQELKDYTKHCLFN